MTISLIETGWNLYVGLTISIVILALFAAVLLDLLTDVIRWMKDNR